MINILIVEDDNSKISKICKVLTELEGIDIDHIKSFCDTNSAKRELSETHYDLLILDIALPLRIDKLIDRKGGIKLLDEIFNRDVYHIPEHIIGITAYEDIFAEASSTFTSRLLTLIQFDTTSDEWIPPLQARVKHIIASKSTVSVPIEFESYLAIVCAMDMPELSSILNISQWSWQQIHLANDDTIYYEGRLEKDSKTHKLFAAGCTRMGTTSAAILSMKMIASFRPRYLAIAGMTAGMKARTRFGDILVADPSWHWGNGKFISDHGKVKFLAAPHQIPLNPGLRNKLRQFAMDKESLSKIKYSWPGNQPNHELSLRVGPIASGASVLADGCMSEQILSQHRELIGIEMETYGVYAACEEATKPTPLAFSMKSVVDFAGKDKNDSYQKYAAYTSAHALKVFVEKYL